MSPKTPAAEHDTFRLPAFYPILDVGTVLRWGGSVRDSARSLLAGGAQILQLRDKQSSPQQVLAHAKLLSEELACTSCMPVMNDRVDLALLAGWPAVHLGHKDLSPDAARTVAGPQRLLVGVSTHNEAQVAAAEAGSADYIAVGPVFGTATKADAEPVVGLEGVRRARALTRKPLVAIGGISLDNAAAVREAGADSVAVVGALFLPGISAASRVEAFLRLLG